MPRIKRFFPKSLDINDDPEVWAFTDEFGDRSMRTIDQVLANIERSENRWRLVGDWSASLSRKVRQQPANVRRQVLQMISNGWLTVEEQSADGSPLVLSARNYWKFHKRPEPKRGQQEPNWDRSGPQLGSLRPTDRPTDLIKSPEAASGAFKKPGEKGEMGERFRSTEFTATAKRICGNNGQYLDKLVQWILSMKLALKDEPIARANGAVEASLAAVKKKIDEGYPIRSVWGLLDTIFAEERTKFIQGPENQAHKGGSIPAEVREMVRGIK